jgi:ATP-dependent Clp protease ATP-binding subunit ClpA
MPVATATVDAEKVGTTFDHLDDNYEFHFVKKLDKDIKLEPDASPKKEISEPIELFETEETHVDKQLKLNDGKAKKIRRLELDSSTEKRRHSHNQKKSLPLFRLFFLFTTISAVGLLFINPELCDELIQTSRREYNVLRHGKVYCTNQLDPGPIVDVLDDQIVGQAEALKTMENVLKSHKTFSSLILHGPTGTGKTLTGQILRQNFPWQENANIIVYSPNTKFDLTSITRRMSSCGHNLLIIDDLYPVN